MLRHHRIDKLHHDFLEQFAHLTLPFTLSLLSLYRSRHAHVLPLLQHEAQRIEHVLHLSLHTPLHAPLLHPPPRIRSFSASAPSSPPSIPAAAAPTCSDRAANRGVSRPAPTSHSPRSAHRHGARHRSEPLHRVVQRLRDVHRFHLRLRRLRGLRMSQSAQSYAGVFVENGGEPREDFVAQRKPEVDQNREFLRLELLEFSEKNESKRSEPTGSASTPAKRPQNRRNSCTNQLSAFAAARKQAKTSYIFAHIAENLVKQRRILRVEERFHERKLRQRRVRHHLLSNHLTPAGIRSNCGSKRRNRGRDRRLAAAVRRESAGR